MGHMLNPAWQSGGLQPHVLNARKGQKSTSHVLLQNFVVDSKAGGDSKACCLEGTG
jgi:hypothetical protein